MNKCIKYQWKDLWQSNFGPKSHVARHLLLYFSTWMNEDGKNCYMSRETISRHTGLSIKTISNHTQALMKQGWIKKQRIHIGRKKELLTYFPNIPKWVLKKTKTKNS